MTQASSGTSRAERWLTRLRESNHMLWMVGTLSFLEAIVVPVPMELVLVPLMLICRNRIWQLAHVTLAGCLLASLLGYGVGMALYQSVGTWFIEAMGYQEANQTFQQFFDRHGFMAIVIVGILPIPFQVAMISAGLSGYPLYLFVPAAVVARGVRYYGLAWLVQRFGSRAQALWQRHGLWAAGAAAAVLLAIYFITDRLVRQML